MLIYVAEKNEIHPKAVALLRNTGHVITYSPINKKLEAVFVRTYTRIDDKFLDKFSNLKYIIRAGVGLDNIDVKSCDKKGIKIFSAPGSNANSVAEFAVGMMIVLIKNINQQSEQVKKDRWRDKDLMGWDLSGKTIGLVGCGAIGKLISKKLTNFDVKILGYDPYVDKKTLSSFGIEKTTFEQLVKNSDVISLHLPLMPETQNMISLNTLKNMKKTAVLINTSRGGLINEKDLLFALKNKIISSAAVDVFENEPNINPKLKKISNLYLTPHIAAYTFESDLNMSLQAAQNFLSAF